VGSAEQRSPRRRGTRASTSETLAGELIAQRYRVTGLLGSGGVGEVAAVFDEVEHKPRALKRLLSLGDERHREMLEGALRREYAILAQFAHPNVVEVFDFGVDAGRTFYTMEHLVGAHPGDAGPMPWRDVCRMLVTLCGPLALLHSRGWVHRDVSPRNVFVVESGAKLLDFGAMAALDEAHSPMGATPCLAPETLRRERIDARTDVFGLGALGYFALTGRHAFPARDLSHLPVLWKSALIRPRELVRDMPEGLDELILALLSLDMQARPRQLAEVVARLISVAELPNDGASTLLQACLTTPGLVGRDAELARLKSLLHLAAEGQGTCGLVRGPIGSGRTRLLDALAVEAEVLGHRVLRAEGGRPGTRAYGLTGCSRGPRRAWGATPWHTDGCAKQAAKRPCCSRTRRASSIISSACSRSMQSTLACAHSTLAGRAPVKSGSRVPPSSSAKRVGRIASRKRCPFSHSTICCRSCSTSSTSKRVSCWEPERASRCS
jgi:hypothetical protein